MIDINNVQQRCGRPVKNLRQNGTNTVYPWIGEAENARDEWITRTWSADGLHIIGLFNQPLDLVPIPAKPESQPEIDWTKPVQILDVESDKWINFRVIDKQPKHVYGQVECLPVADKYMLLYWLFRNTPVEPERVRGWMEICETDNGDIECFFYESRDKIEDSEYFSTIAIIPVDVPMGHGLDDAKELDDAT